MARIPDAVGDGEVAARIRARRPGGRLRPIDCVLLHAPRLADGWNSLLGTIRRGTDLPPDLRELVVLRIAVLNNAPYEWDAHLDDAEAAGLSSAQLTALRTDEPGAEGDFDERQRLVLRLTDTMTRDIQVPDDLFERVRRSFAPAQVVELVAVVAAYNMVSRLAVALGVEEPEETP
ncbi:carboxymuconolactone decarboxylase family protein [Streptomyces sp. NPDC090106]|uniref:carboxymuconolactone decarboxylase family protein n=1 Tax=Streptomyces sp. NPDC090106 TaxID=3365946 RepID=UPI0038128F0B